jgi:hypothetical protein
VSGPKNWSSARQQAVADAQKEDQGKRHLVPESDAQTFIANNSDYTWAEMEAIFDVVTDYLTPKRRTLLGLTGIDGIAIEVAATVSGSLGLGLDFTPLGASFFFPFHTGVSDKTYPHPVDDAPHCFLFSGIGFDLGVSAGADAGVDMQVVLADHWGGADTITVGSWGGSVISVDASAGISVKVGLEANWTIYFTSIKADGTNEMSWWDYAETAAATAANPGYGATYGALKWLTSTDSGWHGFGMGAGLATGVEIELSGGVSLTKTLNGWLGKIFGRPDVEKAMEEMKQVDLEEQGDWHYQAPEDPLNQFVGWFADSTSGVGEALEE